MDQRDIRQILSSLSLRSDGFEVLRRNHNTTVYVPSESVVVKINRDPTELKLLEAGARALNTLAKNGAQVVQPSSMHLSECGSHTVSIWPYLQHDQPVSLDNLLDAYIKFQRASFYVSTKELPSYWDTEKIDTRLAIIELDSAKFSIEEA